VPGAHPEPIIAFVSSLLSASSVRIDVKGVPAVDGLSFASTGDCVLFLGAARALFEAAAGLRRTLQGELRVDDRGPLDAVRAGVLASAPLDSLMPRTWTPLEYVTWSARLAGHPRRAASELAREALRRLDVDPETRTKLGGATLATRRTIVLAAAMATGAATLFIEDPVTGLPADAARALGDRLCAALAGRRAAFFAARVEPDSPIALAADEALVFDGSRVALQGTLAEIARNERTFSLRVEGDVAAFADAVRSGGGRLLGPPGKEIPGQVQLSIDLGSLRTRDLLRMAAAANAVVLELRPFGRAFA
jgi:ABC-type multidrug transport system ATPase subunit